MHAVVAAERAAAVLAVDGRRLGLFVVYFYLCPLRPIIDFVVVVAVVAGPVLPHNGVGRRGLVARIAAEEFRDVDGWTFAPNGGTYFFRLARPSPRRRS